MRSSPHIASIHILDDDSLLHVFYFCRPFLFGEDEDEDARIMGGWARWVNGRWWYRLVHVCQRWRNVIFRSSSYLALSLVCTNGTPVADMLAHSPHLPLVIDYSYKYRDLTAEDGKGAILALKQCDRVRGVRLFVPTTTLQALIMAMDEEYPILEYLIIQRTLEDSTIVEFSKTLQAPHIRHLTAIGFALPIESQLLIAAVRLVTLLIATSPSTYLHPNTLLRWLSSMLQLETLVIAFFHFFHIPNPDKYKPLTHTPIITPATLPNLHLFKFRGRLSFMEALVHHITTPCLEKLKIITDDHFTFFVPHLVQFMNTTETSRFDSAKFVFLDGHADLKLYSRGVDLDEVYALSLTVEISHPIWQVSSMAQISNALGEAFSVVEHLALEQVDTPYPDVDPTEWRQFFRPFNTVKTLLIAEQLVENVSRCLQLDDGEVPLELLPDLQEITYSGSGNQTGDEFTSFIDARQNAGRPITLTRY